MTDPIDTTPEAIAALLDELRTIGCFKNGDARCTCGIGQNAADLIQALTAERDEARAQVAMAYEVAAKELDTHGGSVATNALGQRLCCSGEMCGCQGADVGSFLQYLIRALTPADATAALAARDAAMRNEGRRRAAAACDWGDIYGDNAVSAILASLEPEGGE